VMVATVKTRVTGGIEEIKAEKDSVAMSRIIYESEVSAILVRPEIIRWKSSV